jgi:hypothetical protein
VSGDHGRRHLCGGDALPTGTELQHTEPSGHWGCRVFGGGAFRSPSSFIILLFLLNETKFLMISRSSRDR